MTVRELIAALETLNPDVQIVVPSRTGDFKDPDLFAGSNTFYRRPGRELYHSELRHEDDEAITAVVLS